MLFISQPIPQTVAVLWDSGFDVTTPSHRPLSRSQDYFVLAKHVKRLNVDVSLLPSLSLSNPYVLTWLARESALVGICLERSSHVFV